MHIRLQRTRDWYNPGWHVITKLLPCNMYKLMRQKDSEIATVKVTTNRFLSTKGSAQWKKRFPFRFLKWPKRPARSPLSFFTIGKPFWELAFIHSLGGTTPWEPLSASTVWGMDLLLRKSIRKGSNLAAEPPIQSLCIHPGPQVHMLDIECFSFLNRALEEPTAPIVSLKDHLSSLRDLV